MSTPPPRGTNYVAPGQQKHLRACMVCSVVQLQTRFLTDGCPNCETHLLLAHNRDAIDECTSQVWEGLITLTDPTTSWVARWQRLDGYVPGVYAVKVTGALPEERVMDLEGGGVVYIP